MTTKEFKIQLALGSLSNDMKVELIDNNTPVEILEVLSKDKDWYVRDKVALNRNTPIEILEILSKDKYWPVRYNVASNSNTPVEILEVLNKDKDEWLIRDKAREGLNDYQRV